MNAARLEAIPAERACRVRFVTPEMLFRLLTAHRWELIRALAAGPMSLTEAARRVNRDVWAVHRDVRALLDAGVLKTADGRVVFPFDFIHIDVMWFCE
jgi:predicted transcriptional regulator